MQERDPQEFQIAQKLLLNDVQSDLKLPTDIPFEPDAFYQDDAEVFGAAFSRLANTNGTMLIESPPRRPSGMIYKIYEMSKLKKNIDKDSALAQFKIHEIPASMAVQAGLITQEFLDAERERLGPLYPMYYECDFYNSSSTWYKPEYFQYGEYGEDM